MPRSGCAPAGRCDGGRRDRLQPRARRQRPGRRTGWPGQRASVELWLAQTCRNSLPQSRHRDVSCSPNRVATAPGSTGRCRQSRWRWTSSDRPSTCAGRSCTTRMSSARWRNAARSSSLRLTRYRRARSWCFPRTASRPRCARTRNAAGCVPSTPPARSSPRCTTRRAGSRPRTTTSCWSATAGTRRSSARRGRPRPASVWWKAPTRLQRSRSETRRGWSGCPRPRCPWTRPRRPSARCASASPRCSTRRATTSAMRRRTARPRSRSSQANRIWSSWWARPTPLTRSG